MKTLHLNDRVSFLKPVFLQLEKSIKQYGEAFDWSELPYFFNERATISLLQSASWQAGLLAIEEYVTTKYGAKNKRGNGRCDIYIAEKAGLQEIEFEAKQKWPTLKLRPNSVKTWLDKGDKDANRNRNTETQASLTFVVPKIPVEVEDEQHIKLVNKIVEKALETGIDGLHFWTSSESWKHESPDRAKGIRYRWPSLITLIRVSKVRGEKPSALKASRLPLSISVT